MVESKIDGTYYNNFNTFNNLLVMEVLYATLSSESKSVRISKTYQKEKAGLSEG